MPTYTYKCKSCDYQFDQRQSMADDPLVDCPNCGEPQLRKVINSAGIVFKGSGFYVTDNRNGAKSTVSTTSSKDQKGSDDTAKSEKSTDTTSEKTAKKETAAAE